MTGQIIGMTGDLTRGAKAIGLDSPRTLSELVLREAIERNPDATKFNVYVNQFQTFQADRMIAYSGLEDKFSVHVDQKYSQQSWRIEPVEE